MKNTIERYKIFIFIYVIICFTGVTINLLNIEGTLDTQNVNILSYDNSHAGKGLWPFVKFIEYHDNFYVYATHDNDFTSFNGIFYRFDVGEFLLYIGILIGFLVYKAYIAKSLNESKNNISQSKYS